MHLFLAVYSIIAAWKWGDWKNWRHYHATMVYMPTMSLLYYFYCQDKMLWRIFPDFGLPSMFSESLYFFIIYPATVLLFLTDFPDRKTAMILYVLKWVGIYFFFELIANQFDLIVYYNGWNLGYSFFFLCMMFPMIRLHHLRPVTTYILSALIIIVLIQFFDIPSPKWKE